MNKCRGVQGLILCLILLTVLGGCQTLPPGMARVDRPSQHYVMKGFSISVPAGNDWYVQMQGENAILFYRMTDPDSAHSIVAGVKPFSPPMAVKSKEEFEKLLKDSIEEERQKSKRFRGTGMEVLSDKRFGEYSIFVHTASKDFSPAKMPSDTEYLLLNIYAYYIRPPKSDVYLHLWYSERSRPGDSDANIAEKAEIFFQSFQLMSLEAKP